MDIRNFLLKTASELEAIANSLELELKTANLGIAPNEMEELVGTFGDKALQAIELLDKKQALNKTASLGTPVSSYSYSDDVLGELNEFDIIHLNGGI